MTCNTYVGVGMPLVKSMRMMKAFKTRTVFMMQHEILLCLRPRITHSGRKAVYSFIYVNVSVHTYVYMYAFSRL